MSQSQDQDWEAPETHYTHGQPCGLEIWDESESLKLDDSEYESDEREPLFRNIPSEAINWGTFTQGRNKRYRRGKEPSSSPPSVGVRKSRCNIPFP